jgi:putative transposase
MKVSACNYKSNRNVVFSSKYHIIWCPKYRRAVLSSGVDVRLKEIILETAKEIKADVIELEVMPDHIHLLVEVDPQFGVNQLVKLLKGRSSYLLGKEFPFLKSGMPCLWTNSCFVSTVGGAPLEVIRKYVEQRKQN